MRKIETFRFSKLVSITSIIVSLFSTVVFASNSIPSDAAFSRVTTVVAFAMGDNKWVVNSGHRITNLNGPWVLYWDDTDSFLSYEVQISTSSNMSNPRTYTRTYTKAPGMFDSASVELTGMSVTMGSTYYVRIRITDSPSATWSSIYSVKATNGYT